MMGEDFAATILHSTGKLTSCVRLTFELFQNRAGDPQVNSNPWMSVHCYHIKNAYTAYLHMYEERLSN